MADAKSKDERLNLRVSKEQKYRLEHAAEVLDESMTAFVVRESLAAADRVMADRTRFELSDDDWQEFLEQLDRPAREIPELKRLFEEARRLDAGK